MTRAACGLDTSRQNTLKRSPNTRPAVDSRSDDSQTPNLRGQWEPGICRDVAKLRKSIGAEGGVSPVYRTAPRAGGVRAAPPLPDISFWRTALIMR